MFGRTLSFCVAKRDIVHVTTRRVWQQMDDCVSKEKAADRSFLPAF